MKDTHDIDRRDFLKKSAMTAVALSAPAAAQASSPACADDSVRLPLKSDAFLPLRQKDASGQHRVVCPMKTDRVSKEIQKRGVRPVPVESEMGARHGGGIRCATLVTNRDE